MYSIRISKNIKRDRVNIRLSASHDIWEADMFGELADLMQRYEILKIKLPLGKTYFEISHFPVKDLRSILFDFINMGFSIECPLVKMG